MSDDLSTPTAGQQLLLPDRVRQEARLVTARARFVTIDEDAINRVAASLPIDRVGDPALEPGDLPDVDPAGTVAWVLTVNAVNFGSGFFPVLAKRPGLSGSRTVFAALRGRFDRSGPFTAEALGAITADECAALFGQDPNGPAAELMGWFAAAWNSLGTTLLDRHDGSFEALVATADGSAAVLADLLVAVPGWEDEWEHDGAPVPLAKRAQIVPAHLAMAFRGTGPGRFDDLDRLTIFADNLVPHVLRLDGVLRFDDELVERIDAGELLTPGSPEEVEIRAVAVEAAERIVSHLRERGHRASAMGLDQVLWNRGAGPTYKARPRHRSRSTAY